MPPAPVPSAVDFDSPEYDAQTGPGLERDGVVAEVVNTLLAAASTSALQLEAHRAAATAAVDACLEACLTSVDMQYVRRDDRAVTTLSLECNSWEVEPAPAPCSADTWLRAAMPDMPRPDTHFLLNEFLRGGGASKPLLHSPSMSSRRAQIAGLPQGGSSSPLSPERSRTLAGSPSRATRSQSRSGSPSRTMSSHPQRAQPSALSPPRRPISARTAAAEDRLREELALRKVQAQAVQALAAKDAAERNQLTALRRDLKGQDYTYDHHGQVVLVAGFDPDKASPLEGLSGPAHRVALPGDDLPPGSPMRVMAQSLTRKADVRKGNAVKERQLNSDYVEAPPKTQPSTMQTMAMSPGVTLRQGGAAKLGPPRPKQQQVGGTGMTREEHQRFVAQQQAQQRQQQQVAAMQQAAEWQQQRQQNEQRVAGLRAQAAGGSGSRLASLTGEGSGDAAAAGQLAQTPSQQRLVEEASGTAKDFFAGYPSTGGIMVGAKARDKGDDSPPRPETPDRNLSILGASDWGMPSSAGSGANRNGYGAPSSLPFAKPSERQRELEVGRAVRMPRDRAAQPTMTPPLSPVRAGRVR